MTPKDNASDELDKEIMIIYLKGRNSAATKPTDITLGDYLLEARGRLQEWSDKRLLGLIDDLDDPYPTTLFTPITSEQWTEIDKLLTEHMGFRIDRVSGNLCGQGFRVAQYQLRNKLKGASDENT